MASYKIGCFGQLTRFLLIIVNVLFLILGLAVLIMAIVLRWGSSSFNKLINIPEMNTLIDSASAISTVTIILLILGGFIILLSLFGICGTKYMNRFFLIVYEIIVMIIFLSQIIAILVLLFSGSSIESDYRNALNQTVSKINDDYDTHKDQCQLMFALSDSFKCCGANGPSDFKNSTLVTDMICCKESKMNQPGCADETIKMVTNNVLYLVVIPGSIILAIEFFAIISVPFLIGKAGNKKANNYDFDY